MDRLSCVVTQPMKDSLVENRVFLVTNLSNIPDIMDDLVAKKVFPDTEDVLCTDKRKEQVRYLLDRLQKRPVADYWKFIACLFQDRIGQGNIADKILSVYLEKGGTLPPEITRLRQEYLDSQRSDNHPPGQQHYQSSPQQPAARHVSLMEPDGDFRLPPPQPGVQEASSVPHRSERGHVVSVDSESLRQQRAAQQLAAQQRAAQQRAAQLHAAQQLAAQQHATQLHAAQQCTAQQHVAQQWQGREMMEMDSGDGGQLSASLQGAGAGAAGQMDVELSILTQPMKDSLVENTDFLVTYLTRIPRIMDILVAKKVFPDYEDVLCTKDKYQQVRNLLDRLEKRPVADYWKFIACLFEDRIGQGHIANKILSVYLEKGGILPPEISRLHQDYLGSQRRDNHPQEQQHYQEPDGDFRLPPSQPGVQEASSVPHQSERGHVVSVDSESLRQQRAAQQLAAQQHAAQLRAAQQHVAQQWQGREMMEMDSGDGGQLSASLQGAGAGAAEMVAYRETLIPIVAEVFTEYAATKSFQGMMTEIHARMRNVQIEEGLFVSPGTEPNLSKKWYLNPPSPSC